MLDPADRHSEDGPPLAVVSTLTDDLGLATLADEPPNVTPQERVDLATYFRGRAAAVVPSGPEQRVSVTQTALKNAICDARLVGPSTFTWNVAIAAGNVAERAVTSDLQTARSRDPEALVIGAARTLVAQTGPLSEFLTGLAPGDKHALIERVGLIVARSRECLPGIDRVAHRVVSQSPVRFRDPASGLQCFGVRDLVLSTRRDRCTPHSTVDVELKTGTAKPEFNLHQARLYALLAHLAPPNQPAPQRVATINVETGRWIVEEVTFELLTAVARQVLDVARRIDVLENTPHEVEPRWCGLDWCEPCNTRNNDDPQEVSA